jgi:hypothetical protein
VQYLEHQTERARLRLAQSARERVLDAHSGLKRADELLGLLSDARAHVATPRIRVVPGAAGDHERMASG